MWRGQLYWLHLCLCFKEKVHGHSKVMNVDHRPAAPQVRKYRIDTCIIYLQMQAHGLCWLMSGKTVFTFFVLPMGLISAENGCLCFQVAVSSSTSTECADPTESCLLAAAHQSHLVPSSSLFFALIQFELAHPSTPLILPFLHLDS